MDAESIRDLFEGLGPIRIQRMFGGHGIYRDSLMFALEAEGEIYIKADAGNVELFEAAGSRRFTYSKGDGKVYGMSYWSLPDAGLDDPEEATRWARHGIEAAHRAAASKPKSNKKKASA